MSRVGTDILMTPAPAEASAGRGSATPLAADAPTFGDHLSRAAQPAKEAAKNVAVAADPSSPTQLPEPSAAVTAATNEEELVAAIQVVDCELLVSESAVSLVEANTAGADTDEHANENLSAETISMVIALAATPPSEPIVQVDTITLGEEAEQLADESTEELPAANRLADKVAPQGIPSAKSAADVRFSHLHATVDVASSSAEANPTALPHGKLEGSAQATLPLEGTSTVEVPPAEFNLVTDTTEVIVPVAAASGVEKNTEKNADKKPTPAKTSRATAVVSSEAKQAAAASDAENIAAEDPAANDSAQPARDRRESLPKVSEYVATARPQSETSATASAAALAAAAAVAPRGDAGVSPTSKAKLSEDRPADTALPAVDAPSSTTATATPPITTAPTETPRSAMVREGNNAAPLASSTVGPRSAVPVTNGSEVDRVRFVQRVARAVTSAIDRGGELTLRLSPAELGSMRLEVVVRDGVMTAHIETETSAARTALLDNLPALRDRLAEQNVRIEKFEVELQGGATGSLPDRTSDQSSSSQREQAGRGNRKRTDSLTEITGPTAASPRLSRDGQLNVVV